MIRLATFLPLVIAQCHLLAQTQPATNSPAEPLKLLISVEQQAITAPFPARITMHLHNAGNETLWLYRHARSKSEIGRARSNRVVSDEEAPRPGGESTGGSMLEVQLQPEGSQQVSTPAGSEVLESVGLPHPRLVRVAPGEDYEEKAALRVSPALAGPGEDGKPVWGRYRLSATYSAKYSNTGTIDRVLGVRVWQGEATSNSLALELLPPAASARGTTAGTVVAPDGHTIAGVLVTLSDAQQRSLAQVLTDPQGRFAFAHLPLGIYWTTARRESSPVDTAVFQHVELTAAEPAASVQLVLLPPEIYEPKQMLHKPVLFRITDSAGAPSSGTALEVTWSSGTVLDNVKGETSGDGTVILDLIPGRNFVTLKRRGCKKEEQRADVAGGEGIDGFKFALECK